MAFRYEQTVVFDNGGWLHISARDDNDQPMSPEDLSYVMNFAEKAAYFERDRAIRQQQRLIEIQRIQREREMPLCWPGFRPLT